MGMVAAGISATYFRQSHAANAKGQSPLNDQKPYVELLNPIVEDEKKVLSFFSFSCPYCRQYHDVISNWAKGLPTRFLTHEWVHVAGDKNGMAGATVLAAARVRFPKDQDLNAFFARAYSMVQDQNKSMMDGRAWSNLLGQPIDASKHAISIEKSVVRLTQFQITNTPSIGIAGRYVITPEIVGGRTDMFVQLANGVTSMALASMGYNGR